MAVNGTNSTAQALHGSFRSVLEGTNSAFIAGVLDHPWAFFAATVLAGFLLSYLVVFLSKTVIKAFTRKTETDLDDQLLEKLQHPVAWSLFILSLNVALVPLSLSSRLAEVANLILISINILFVTIIVNRILAVLLHHYGTSVAGRTDSKVDDNVLPIMRRFIAVMVYAIGVLMVLGAWGVQIAPLLAGAGIAGLAFAFAMQESLKNIFGGISLAFDHAYAIGDRIKLSDGTVGTVHDISLRSTKIKTFDGDLIVVPNGNIANDQFQTYAQPSQTTRVVIPFGLTYGTDPQKVKDVVFPLLKTMPHFFEDADHAPNVFFIGFGASSIDFQAVFWVDDYRNSWPAKIAAIDAIYRACNKAKLEFAYPTQTIYLKK